MYAFKNDLPGKRNKNIADSSCSTLFVLYLYNQMLTRMAITLANVT